MADDRSDGDDDSPPEEGSGAEATDGTADIGGAPNADEEADEKEAARATGASDGGNGGADDPDDGENEPDGAVAEPEDRSDAGDGTSTAAATDPLTDVETDTRTRTVADEGGGSAERGATADEGGGSAERGAAADETTAVSGKAADEVYCSSCGEAIKREAEVCPNCGVRQAGSSEKEPLLAALLSFIIPGAGQVYNGQVGRGALAFVGALVVDFLITIMAIVLTVILIGPLLFLLIPVVHAVIMYDAYHQAELINQGEVQP